MLFTRHPPLFRVSSTALPNQSSSPFQIRMRSASLLWAEACSRHSGIEQLHRKHFRVLVGMEIWQMKHHQVHLVASSFSSRSLAWMAPALRSSHMAEPGDCHPSTSSSPASRSVAREYFS